MDTSRWKQGEEFSVLDLVAQFQARTSASLSFQLGKSVDRDTPRLPEMKGGAPWDSLPESGSVFVVLGWLDVHHPCDGLHPLRIRAGLPDRYVSGESMRNLVPQVVAALGLPADVPYHVDLAGLSQQTFTEAPWNGFASTTRWQPPSSQQGHQPASAKNRTSRGRSGAAPRSLKEDAWDSP